MGVPTGKGSGPETTDPEAPAGDSTRLGTADARVLAIHLFAYVVSAFLTLRPDWFGITIALENVVWMGSGIVLAVVLRLGPRVLPWVALTEFSTTVLVGDPLIAALGSSIGNTLEAGLAWWLLRGIRASIVMGRARDVVALVGLASGVSALAGAAVSTYALILGNGLPVESFSRIWSLWWLTHANGMLLVTPFLLAVSAGQLERIRQRPAEALVAAGALLAVGLLLFGASPEDVGSRRLLYVPFPFLLWAAFRFRLVGASFGNLLLALPAMLGTAAQRGPFAAPSPNEALIPLWIFIAVTAITALLIAGVVEDREREIEARLRSEEEQRKLSERMQRTQRTESLGLLAGGIAHDFNNLLVTIMGNAELAERKLGEGHPAEKSISEITRASQRASELCRQMLAFAGRGRLSNGVVDLREVASEMTELLKVSFREGTSVEVDVDPVTPGIWGDVTQIRRVVLNLLTNAHDALPEEGGRIRVATGPLDPSEVRGMDLVTGERPRSRSLVHLTVEDDGVGMNEEMRERVFDPFFTTRKMGRGLGLAAVHGIVRAHGGALELRSAPGRGSRFRVILPATRHPIPLRGGTVSLAAPGELEGTVLVVEDEGGVREVVAEMLQGMGLRVLTAGDGVEAIELYEARRAEVDVVLMDLRMPRMDGYEALQRLREIDGRVRVVLTTGNADEPEQVEQRWGVQVLPKPYRSDILRRALERALATGAPV